MEEIPPYARFVAIGMAAAAAVGLLINHFMPESQSAARLMLLCLGPMALLLGIGGSVEPKVIWSLGKYGQHLPLKYKIIGEGGRRADFDLGVRRLSRQNWITRAADAGR